MERLATDDPPRIEQVDDREKQCNDHDEQPCDRVRIRGYPDVECQRHHSRNGDPEQADDQSLATVHGGLYERWLMKDSC